LVDTDEIPEYRIDVRILNNLLSVAEVISDEIIIDFDEFGIHMLFVDVPHIQMCEITVPKFAIDSIRNPKTVSIGLNISKLNQYIGRLCKSRKLTGESATLKIGEDKLFVVTGCDKQNTRKLVDTGNTLIHDTKSFALLDISNFSKPKIPELKLTTEINDIKQPVLKRAVSECSEITDYFNLVTKSGKSKIYVDDGDNTEHYECPIGTTHDEDAESMYAAYYFTNRISRIVDSHSPSRPILISLKYATNYPVMMEWENHGVKFMIFTAPRIEA